LSLRVEIIVIGNELLNGDLADTNTARLGGWLRKRGLGVTRGQTVPDDEAMVAEAFATAASRSDLVLVSGGMGPTEDDLTMSAAARFAGVALAEDTVFLERLKRRFEKRGYPFTPNNARQALIPAGADALHNPVGTAPCVRLVQGEATFFFFPGVPRELTALIDLYLEPWLTERAAARPYISATFLTFGKTESQVASLLDGLTRDARMHVAYRAHFPQIQVTLHVFDADADAARALLDDAAAHVRSALSSVVFSEDGGATFAAALGARLVAADSTLATAESCTGGLVAKLCTDIPGSSAWFLEGAVTYSNAAKSSRLGVPPELIVEDGAVSESVARAMAEGIRRTARSTYGVGITGIAGPGGGTEGKPVGTVHMAVAGPDGTQHFKRTLPFDRNRNRVVSAFMAMDMVRRALDGAR
jgi:nicotinamide-nucleotide amidase